MTIPTRVFLTMTFFDYPLFTTDTLTFQDIYTKDELNKAVSEKKPLILIREMFLNK